MEQSRGTNGDTKALCVKGACPRLPSMSWERGHESREQQGNRNPRWGEAQGCPRLAQPHRVSRAALERGRGPEYRARAESSLLATLPRGGQGTGFQSC